MMPVDHPLHVARRAWMAPWCWPAWAWLLGLAAVLLIRFPVKFLFSPPFLMDFEVYRTVAQRVMHGAGAQLYNPTTTDVMLFKYAPCWALLWAPLAWLPGHAAAVLWAALTVLWLVLACAQAAQLCAAAGLPVPGWLAIPVVLLLVRPVTAEFSNGQVDILWALLVLTSLTAQLRGRPWSAAAALALALSLKLPAAVFLAYLAARRSWGAVGRVCLLVATANIASSLFLAPDQPLRLMTQWITTLSASGASRAFEIGNQSLLSLAGRFLTADGYRLNIAALSPRDVTLVWLALSTALFGLIVIGPKLQPRRRLAFDGALLTILMVVSSPTCWIATYSALLLPAAVLICVLVGLRGTARTHLPSLLVAGLLVVLSVMTHGSFWRAVGIHYLRNESYVYLVLMILPWFGVALFAFLWRHRAPA